MALLAGLALLAPASVRAGGVASALDQPPPPEPVVPLSLPAIHQSSLPTGLTLIVAPRHSLPLVHVAVVVRAGDLAAPPGKTGLPELTADLLTRGSLRRGRRIDASTLARQAEALGSSVSAGSGPLALQLGMSVIRPNLPQALALLADVLRHPLFEPEELERVRSQALDDWQVAQASPSAVAALLVRRLYWGPRGLGEATTPQTLARIQRADLLDFHRRWVRPDVTAVVLAGDIEPTAARELVQRQLGHWLAPAGPPPAFDEGLPSADEPRQVLLNLPGAGQSQVTVVAPFVGRDAADQRVGQVANAVLGGGYSARVNQQVRIRRGLSYGAGSSVQSYAGGGLISLNAQTDHRNAAQVATLLRGELLRLAPEPPDDAELAARVAALVGGDARQMETLSGLAGRAAELWAQHRPLVSLAEWPAELQAVTAAQVGEFARQHWRAERLRTVVVGDLAAMGAWPLADGAVLRLELPQLDINSATLRRKP